MLKRVDVAAYEVFKTAQDGSFKPGIKVLGLKEDGVGWAQDDNNAKLITPEMKTKVDAAAKGIIDGSIQVVDYRTNNSCPM
jgi:basic membrane protein A